MKTLSFLFGYYLSRTARQNVPRASFIRVTFRIQKEDYDILVQLHDYIYRHVSVARHGEFERILALLEAHNT
jgi:hypothetical protein